MPSRKKTAIGLITTCITALTVASCGGGGGGGGGGSSSGDGSNDPGYTTFQLERDSLDTGDITNASVTVYDINPQGVVLKFYYPLSLRFLPNSAFIYTGNSETPEAVTPIGATTEEGRYLVFFLSPAPDGEPNQRTVQINLKAVSGDQEAFLEIDLDNNDPTIPDSYEFNAGKPNFTAIDRFNVDIGGKPAGTPTPVGTGTAAPGGTTTPAATATPAT
jgi:hypothetical protein